MNADENIIQLKHRVLQEVATLALQGRLEEERDEIPYTIIPGPVPQFRCCIYKEREIIRQRVKLAEGKSLRGNPEGNIIQVIESACADCPISSYTVTENCQNCLGKSCISACRFGAIEPGRLRSHIDPQKCKECGKCAEACPYNAIAHLVRPCKHSCPVDAITYDEYGISVIDENKCIRCGRCIHRCPFGAIGTKTAITQVIAALKGGKPVYAMLAPAALAQYGKDITLGSWRQALKKLGFRDCLDGSLGADMTAAAEAKEWLKAAEQGEKKVTSCCPAFVNLVHLHYNALSDRVSDTVSPMCALSRMIKADDPEAVTVFIGPCIAKKSEVADHGIEGNADFALTFSEIMAILRAADITLEPAPADYSRGSVYGRRFAASGGVTGAVLRSAEELGHDAPLSVLAADGAEECKKALLLLRAGRLKEDFVEGMACQGGCIGGPSAVKSPQAIMKDRNASLAEADSGCGVLESLKNADPGPLGMGRS